MTTEFASKRRTPVADERQGHPGQGQHLEVAGGDDERLDPDDQRQADREERPKVIGRGGTDPEPAFDEHEKQPQDRHDADDAQLLTEGGQREVGMDLGDREAAADHRADPLPRPTPSSPPRANACSAWTIW